MKKELVIIAPTYNESQILETFISDWIIKFRDLSISFEFRIYNDGSTDSTENVLAGLLKKYPELHVFTNPNSGHGPTISKAYNITKEFEWVFQIDSDHELLPDTFSELWSLRCSYDILMGVRTNRSAPLFRRLLTKILAQTIRMFFGKGVIDINIPYRLIRSSKLTEFLPYNTSANFAPNTLMTAFAIKNKWRIKTLPVTYVKRKNIKGTGFSYYMLKGAYNSLRQLLKFLFDSYKVR